MKLETGIYIRFIKDYKPYDQACFPKGTLKELRVDWNAGYSIFSNYEIHEYIKASHNMIDLIEVGDYVNGYKVNYIDVKKNQWVNWDGNGEIINKEKFGELIKSMVTKEHYANGEFEVNANERV